MSVCVPCLLPEGDTKAENSLSSGFWARTASSELRPPLLRMDEAAAPARVVFYPTRGRPDRVGKQEVLLGRAISYMIKQHNR